MDRKMLKNARETLARYESKMMSDDAVRDLTGGFDLLEEVIEGGESSAHIARNVGNTYAAKTVNLVIDRMQSQGLTEPQAEHIYKLMGILESYEFGERERIQDVKMKVFSTLFDHYFQGYTRAERKARIEWILQELDI